MEKRNIIKNQKGFTLIEIIAVLVILGILAAVAVPKFMDLQADAKRKAAKGAIAEVKARLSMGYGKYLLNNGVEPDTIAKICGADGVNNADILPTNGEGNVPVGEDFTVELKPDASENGEITVTHFQSVAIKNADDSAITETWYRPANVTAPTGG